MQTNLNIEKIIFKAVQMKFLAMHITNQKLSFDIITVKNIFMQHDLNILMSFGICNVLLSISTNIPVLLMTTLCSRVTYNKSFNPIHT